MQNLLTIKSLFKKSFEFYKKRALLMGVLMIIPALISFIVAAILAPFLIAVPLSGFNISAMLFGGLIVLVIMLAALIAYFLSYVSLFYCIKEENTQISIAHIKSLFSKSFTIVGPFAWATFLSGLIILVGFLLFIVPGIIFSIWFSFVCYIVIFEDIKGMSALKRSKELVKDYWWPVFYKLVVMIIASMVATWIPIIGDALSLLCITPFSMIYTYFIYEDLKKVKSIPTQIA